MSLDGVSGLLFLANASINKTICLFSAAKSPSGTRSGSVFVKKMVKLEFLPPFSTKRRLSKRNLRQNGHPRKPASADDLPEEEMEEVMSQPEAVTLADSANNGQAAPAAVPATNGTAVAA